MSIVSRFLEEVGNDRIFYIESDYLPLLITVNWFKGLDRNGVIRDCYPFLVYKVGTTFKGYWNATKYEGMSEELFDRYMADGLSIPEFTKEYDACSARIAALYESYFEKRDKRTQEELLHLLRAANEAFLALTDRTLAFDALDQKIIERVVKARNFSVDFEKVWRASEITAFSSFELRNDEALLRAWPFDAPERLQYLFSNYTSVPSLSETRALVGSLSRPALQEDIARRTAELEANRKEKDARVAPLTNEEKKVLSFIDWSGWLRDDRKTHITKCDVLFYNLTADLYAKWGIDATSVPVSLIYEVLQGKEANRARAKELKERLTKMATLYEGEDRYVHDPSVSDDDIRMLDEVYMRQHGEGEDGVVRGEIACRGRAKGVVRIITEKTQFSSFTEGEVLVTGMTRPEFVPLMKKASAIVTDEGGITSHAAIVSRELRKPCIIGTKVATKVFKNGDRVEVDAEKGIVRKL